MIFAVKCTLVMNGSVIIPIEKKRGAQDCVDFRKISL